MNYKLLLLLIINIFNNNIPFISIFHPLLEQLLNKNSYIFLYNYY